MLPDTILLEGDTSRRQQEALNCTHVSPSTFSQLDPDVSEAACVWVGNVANIKNLISTFHTNFICKDGVHFDLSGERKFVFASQDLIIQFPMRSLISICE